MKMVPRRAVRSWPRSFSRRSQRWRTPITATAPAHSRQPRRMRPHGGCSAGSTCCGDSQDTYTMRYLATLDGKEHEIEIEELTADSFSISFGKNSFEADLRKVGPASFSVIVDNRSFDFDVAREGEETVVASRSGSTRLTVADASRRMARAAGKRREVSGRMEIKAAMPGRVVNVLVAQGDEVNAEQGIVVVEAMKMENEVKAPKAGKVVEVKVVAGQAVEKGQLMIVIE